MPYLTIGIGLLFVLPIQALHLHNSHLPVFPQMIKMSGSESRPSKVELTDAHK